MMRVFGGGTESTGTRTDASMHPSAPIPIVGPGVGDRIRVRLGDTDHRVFPVILGAGEFGWNVDLPTSHAILDRYMDFGGNAIHASDEHSGGRALHFVGEWLRSRGARDRMVITARVGAHPDNPGLGSVALVRSVESALQLLRTDHLDILSLDGSTDPTTNLEDTLATAEWLVETGKVRTIGAYEFSPERLVEARILSSAGYPRIEVLDAPYNLVSRASFDGDLRLVAASQGLAVTPSHALEHGFLSGRHRSKAALGRSVRDAQLRSNINRRGIRILRALDLVAQEIQAPVAAVAIAWLLAQRPITAAIVNALAIEHVDELMQGAGISLTRVQLAELTRAGH